MAVLGLQMCGAIRSALLLGTVPAGDEHGNSDGVCVGLGALLLENKLDRAESIR